MTTLFTEIDINASAERVWSILTDFEAYPTWNPFIRSISGNVEVGETLHTQIQAPGAKPMAFQPKVLTAERDQELRWLGCFLIPGLFDGEHRFLIESKGENKVHFIQEESFSGILLPLFEKKMGHGTKEGFEAMNIELKRRAEGSIR